MDPNEIKIIRSLLWYLEQEENLDREGNEEVIGVLRRLLNAYLGATRKLFKLRSKTRGDGHE